MNILDTVRHLLAQGRVLLPVRPGEKATRLPKWQKVKATEQNFADGDNVAERLDDIVDVDLDCVEARDLATTLLPRTGRIHGRPSLGPAHYWYRVSGIKSEEFTDIDGKMLVEIRTGSNHYTLIPPSVIHQKDTDGNPLPETEVLKWFSDGEPASVDGNHFRALVVLLASATLIARHWSSMGSRHDAAGALAGFLAARGGANRETFVETFIRGVVKIAGDEEPEDRIRFALDTLKTFNAGGRVTGGPTLENCLPKAVVERLYKWFKVSDADQPLRELKLVSADTIEMKPLKWIWPGRVPVGCFGLIAGREGIGKSIFAYTLVADLTRGRLDGVHKGQPRSVVICATEDSWAHVIKPRLLAAGADTSKVFKVDVITKGINDELLLPADVDALAARVVEQGDVALILLDPLIARLASKLDTHKDAEVRRALEPLSKLADETGVSILGIIHVNKGTSRDPLNMIMASRAFSAVARFVLFVVTDPDDEDRRLVGQAKNNLGGMTQPTMSFTITDHLVTTTAEGDEIRTGMLVWGADDERSIREVISESASTDRERKETPRVKAEVWLEHYLHDLTGPSLRENVMKAAREAGHNDTTLKRAASELGIVSTPSGKKVMWSLPSQRPLPVSAPAPVDAAEAERRRGRALDGVKALRGLVSDGVPPFSKESL